MYEYVLVVFMSHQLLQITAWVAPAACRYVGGQSLALAVLWLIYFLFHCQKDILLFSYYSCVEYYLEKIHDTIFIHIHPRAGFDPTMAMALRDSRGTLYYGCIRGNK